jgi:hypothetical protein
MIHFQIGEKKKFTNADEIICKCYKNKLELNCIYQTEIENKINEISRKNEPNIPWWVELLD